MEGGGGNVSGPSGIVFVSGDEVSTYFFAHFPELSSRAMLLKILNVDKFHSFPTFQCQLTHRYNKKIWRELDKFRHLEHHSIVRTFEVLDSVIPEAVMTEVYPCGSFFDWVLTRTTLSLKLLCQAIHQVCIGLEYLHNAGYAHGHLRPSNILFRTQDPQSAAIAMNTSVREEMRKICCPIPIEEDYCPPELQEAVMRMRHHVSLVKTGIRSGDELQEVDHILSARKESDMWSLGIIASIMLTGSYPQQNNMSKVENAHTPQVKQQYQSMLESFSSQLRDFLVRLLHPSPAARAQAAECASANWYTDAQTLGDKRNLMYILDYGHLRAELEFKGFAQETVELLESNRLNQATDESP